MGMPNKYEREIEEILRNLERTEPKGGFGRRGSGRMHGKASVRRSLPTLRLSFSEWCLFIASLAALCAGGWEYAQVYVQHVRLDGQVVSAIIVPLGGNIITGILALIGAVCIALVVITPFLVRPRTSSSSRRYNNITPLRRSNPFSSLGTRWNLLMLKLRYRKRRDPGQ